jgi:hypothetical protein
LGTYKKKRKKKTKKKILKKKNIKKGGPPPPPPHNPGLTLCGCNLERASIILFRSAASATGNIYLTTGRPEYFTQAAEKADKVLAKDPKNVAALILRGNAAAGLQKIPDSPDFSMNKL